MSERERAELTRQWVATVLSPKLEILEALLRNETVPVAQLNPVWVNRLAADPPIEKSRVSLAEFHSVPLEYGP
jgi:hypothetical protein